MTEVSIPILLCVYRRVEHTAAVINALRVIKPPLIYVSANAAKNDEEKKYTTIVRELIDSIDWECRVVKKYESVHVFDCSVSITNAINWFFSEVDYGIILEDDCIMSNSFYSLCSELLPLYRNDESVFHISGTNLNYNHEITPQLQTTNFALPCWGWATWKRAWSKYSPSMNNWNSSQNIIQSKVANYTFWQELLQLNSVKKIAWDLQWNVDIWLNNGLIIQPSCNLVTNIGFDSLATLTTNKNSRSANLPVEKDVFFHNFTISKSDDIALEQKVIDFISTLSV